MSWMSTDTQNLVMILKGFLFPVCAKLIIKDVYSASSSSFLGVGVGWGEIVGSFLIFTFHKVLNRRVILMLYNARSMLAIHSMLQSCTGNKLQAIRPTVGGHQQKSSPTLWDEVVINRFKIGDYAMHTFLSVVRCRPS